MAKLFIGLAIAVTLAAAALGFLAKGNIDKLQAVLKENKQSLVRAETTQRKIEGELKKSQENEAVATTKLEQQTSELTAAKKDKEEATTQLAEAKMALVAKSKEVDDLTEKVNAGSKNPNPVGGEGLQAEMVTLKADLEKAKSETAEKAQMVETLQKSRSEKDEALANANKEIARYQAGVTKQGLSGKILAVNPGWNFVVLSVGDHQGAATGGVMIVTRGGEPIGRARITSVEPSTSIADIVPGSIRRGVTVQPGDAVIFEGPRLKANAMGTPGPTAPVAPSAPAQ